THVRDRRVVVSKRKPRVQREVLAVQDAGVEGQLDTLVLSLADVDELEARITPRRLQRHRQNRVVDLLVVDRELESDSLLEESGIDPELQFPPDFRLQSRVADVLRRHHAPAAVADPGLIGLDRREDVGLLSGLTPRATELELREPAAAGEER